MGVGALQQQVEFAAPERVNVAQEEELVPIDADAPSEEELRRQDAREQAAAHGDGHRARRLSGHQATLERSLPSTGGVKHNPPRKGQSARGCRTCRT